jgi:hypothetical protein
VEDKVSVLDVVAVGVFDGVGVNVDVGVADADCENDEVSDAE